MPLRIALAGLGIHGGRYARHLLRGDVSAARLVAELKDGDAVEWLLRAAQSGDAEFLQRQLIGVRLANMGAFKEAYSVIEPLLAIRPGEGERLGERSALWQLVIGMHHAMRAGKLPPHHGSHGREREISRRQ